MPDNSLHIALRTLRRITLADDMRYLSIYLADKLLEGRTDHRGLSSSWYTYPLSDELLAVINLISGLVPDDQKTLAITVGLLLDLLAAQVGSARGSIEIKTVRRDYPQIDFEESNKQKKRVYQTDENGAVIMYHGVYSYVYVRIYASKGDASKDKKRLKSVYADRGMGRGASTGGWVAAALADELVTENEILDNWHKGEIAYSRFIDQCLSLVVNGQDDLSNV